MQKCQRDRIYKEKQDTSLSLTIIFIFNNLSSTATTTKQLPKTSHRSYLFPYTRKPNQLECLPRKQPFSFYSQRLSASTNNQQEQAKPLKCHSWPTKALPTSQCLVFLEQLMAPLVRTSH